MTATPSIITLIPSFPYWDQGAPHPYPVSSIVNLSAIAKKGGAGHLRQRGSRQMRKVCPDTAVSGWPLAHTVVIAQSLLKNVSIEMT